MSDLVERFCAHHHAYNDISTRRRVEQKRVLLEFEDHVGGPLTEATGEDLSSYLVALVERGLHVNTVRKYRNLIRPFYTWAWPNKLITADTLLGIREVPCPRGATGESEPNPYSREELDQFYEELDERWPRTEDHLLERWQRGTVRYHTVWRHFMRAQIEAIVALALYAGMRRSEILAADIDDIHPDNAYVVVRSPARKGRRGVGVVREVPYTEGLRKAMERWLELRELVEPNHARPWCSLHPRYGSRPMNERRFGMLLLTVGEWELHRFRHTSATEWARAGVELEKVQKIMGHARLTQTLAYRKLVRDDVARSMSRLESKFDRAVRPREEAA